MAFGIGSLIGIVAGYVGGKHQHACIMRTIDVFYAFPSVLLAVARCRARMGAGIRERAAVADRRLHPADLPASPRAVTTQVRNRDFVEAARASGADRRSPSCASTSSATCWGRSSSTPPVSSSVSMILAVGPLLPRPRRAAARAGMGPDAEHAAHRRSTINPLVAALPGVMIFITSICFNLLARRPARRHGCEGLTWTR